MADFPTPPAAADDQAAALLALRQRAEQQRRHRLVTQPAERQSPQELQRLVQELQVHQVELEMQYEELLATQTEVLRARAQYVDLYDFAPVGYVTVGTDDTITQLNLRAAHLLGAGRQQLQGRPLASCVAPADRPALQTLLTRARHAEHSLGDELGLLRADGTVFYAHIEALRTDEPAPGPGAAAAGPAGAHPPAVVRLALLDSTARRAAALGASAVRFRTLFEQSPDGMALIENNRLVDGNAALLRLLGLADKSQLVRQPLGVFSPARQPDGTRSVGGMRAHLAEAWRRGWHRFEWFRRDAAGQDQWVEITAAPVAVDGQRLMQFSVRDITVPRTARQQLRASEERQQLALDATESGVWRRDLANGLFQGDARTWAMLGRAGQQGPLPIGETDQGVHPADRDRMMAMVEQAQHQGTPIEIEHRYYLPDGQLRYLHVSGRPEPSEPGGRPASLTGLVRDVTVRRQAQEELDYKNRLLDRLLHNLPLILSQLTPEGRYVELAGQGLRRLGIADNAFVGAQIEAVFPALAPAWYQLHADDTLGFVSRTELHGEPAYYQHYGFFDEQQQRTVVFSIDVTERERLRENSLRQEHEQRQRVLAATLEAQEAERRRIAESLHNGLGQLLYATRLALAAPASTGGSRAEKLLDEAIRATRSISFELTPGVLNDFGLAAALQELVERLARERLPLRLHLHGLGSQRLPAPVEIAAYRMAQELMNNVIRHAQARAAALHVSLLPGPPAQLRLLMQDDGCGFDPAAQAADASGGIGLRSIRQRVELLSGRLLLDSQPGHGAAITIELPL